MAEINGLLNRRRALKLYRGFESLPHRKCCMDFINYIRKIQANLVNLKEIREVAQAGSAPGLGPGGRRFESCLPDEQSRALASPGLFYFVFEA